MRHSSVFVFLVFLSLESLILLLSSQELASPEITSFEQSSWTQCIQIFAWNSRGTSGPFSLAGIYLLNFCNCTLSFQYSFIDIYHHENFNTTKGILQPFNPKSQAIENWELIPGPSPILQASEQSVSAVLSVKGVPAETCVVWPLRDCVSIVSYSTSHYAMNRCDKNVYFQYMCGSNNAPTDVNSTFLEAWDGSTQNNQVRIQCSFSLFKFAVFPE
mmetsp:Transcript_44019/g.61876  ORF Transcript_44019/g.61876 Transcript_44019/m.61876 type:complete len:216 (+) Transcript_44019:39-686(+)